MNLMSQNRIQLATFSLAIFLTTEALFCANAMAGNADGGGGKGIVCRNADNSLKSVETLDLWEARELHQETLAPSSGNLEQDVEAALQNLSKSLPMLIKSPDCSNEECLLNQMRTTARKFLDGGKSVLRKRGIKLTDTSDSMELIQPDNCGIEQIINYQPAGAPILLNEDLFQKMDLTNQAALIAHEAYYEVLRLFTGETNSLRVRRAVGYAFSGRDFARPTRRLNRAGDIVCSSSPNPSEGNQILGNDIRFSADFQDIYFAAVQGTPLIGVPTITSNPDAAGLTMLFKGKCTSAPVTVVFHPIEGPVEYDRTLRLSRICTNGTKTFILNAKAPGAPQSMSYVLKCQVQRP